MKRITWTVWTLTFLGTAHLGCGLAPASDEPSASEVGVSIVSGALNNNSNGGVAINRPVMTPKSRLNRLLENLRPIGTAWATTWKCTGGTLTPKYAGPGTYSWTPVSCEVDWDNGKSASSTWSGPFTLVYGSSCDSLHARIENQGANCSMARETPVGGVTRTITGPNGNAYAISHDTNGAGTGWDSSVTPAPNNGGVVLTCDSKGCADGKTLVINGSHLFGTVTPVGKKAKTIWDHTVSTGANPLMVMGTDASRVVTGEVTVEHNLAKYTATVNFDNVGYTEVGCCFPTTGSVSTTFNGGVNSGKTEKLAFGNICGQATLTDVNGTTSTLTLQHCL